MQPIEGFPRWIGRDEELQVEVGDYSDLIYRRNFARIDQEEFLRRTDLFRISIDSRDQQPTGFIWPYAESVLGEAADTSLRISCPEDRIYDEEEPRAKALIEEINSKSRVVRNYKIQPEADLTRYPEDGYFACLLYISITDTKSGRFGRYLVMEAAPWTVSLHFKAAVIKKGWLQLNPKKKDIFHRTVIAARGFEFLLRFPSRNSGCILQTYSTNTSRPCLSTIFRSFMAMGFGRLAPVSHFWIEDIEVFR